MNHPNEEKPKFRGLWMKLFCFTLSLMIWAIVLPWNLITLPRRRRAAAERDAAIRKERKLAEIKEQKAKREREEGIRFKRRAMSEISDRYNFENGTGKTTGRPVKLEKLEDMATKYEALSKDLGVRIPPRPNESKTDQELWEVIGGQSDDTLDAMVFLLGKQDVAARKAAALFLIQLRREVRPLQHEDAHVKAVAELAARTRLLEVKLLPEKSLRRAEIMRRLERMARWQLYGQMLANPTTQQLRSGHNRRAP